MTVLELRSVSKVYGRGAAEVQALRDVSLTVAAGEMVAVMGPSGSGKSSLLTIAGTLEEPTSGAVLVNGEDTLRMSGGAKSRIRRRAIGYVFQDFNLLPGLTAAENVSLPLELDGTSMRKAHLAALKALEELGLGDRARHFPDQMSGGERQRVAIARAVVGERSLLLADEPSGALDSANGEAVMRLIHTYCKRGAAAVVVTHDAQLASWADRVVFLRDGRIVDQTAAPAGPETLLESVVMSMTIYARDDRPVREPEDPRRAAMARRTLSRWAVRLALREWKQRILIVLLIAVASAATLLGIAVASATPGTPNAGTYGTAQTLVELPGNTPGLSASSRRSRRPTGRRASSTTSRSPPARPAAPTCAPRTRRRPTPRCCSRSTPVITRQGRGRWRSPRGSPSCTACGSARPGTSRRGRAPRPAAPSPSPASSRTRPTCSTSSPSSPPASSQAGSSAAPAGADLPRRVHGLRRRVRGRRRHTEERGRQRARRRTTPSSPRRRSCSSSR